MEKRKGGDAHTEERKQFNKFVRDENLIELQINDRKYTWSSLRENPSLRKLDRIFVTMDWETKFAWCKAKSLNRIISYHVPIGLTNWKVRRQYQKKKLDLKKYG